MHRPGPRRRATWTLVILCSLASFAALAADGTGPVASGPTVEQPARFDISPPLRDMVAGMSGAPLSPGPFRIHTLRHPHPIDPALATPSSPDTALQDWAGALVPAPTLLNFQGLSAWGSAPPDTNGSVGTTQYLQMVNTQYAVFDKQTGAMLLGPASINTVWAGFGGLCETSNGGDPIVLFDKAAKRWVISQLEYNGSFTSNYQCVAVSTSDDATGSWARYAYSFGGNLPDYPKLGVWPDGYYHATNTFQSGAFYKGPQACAFDRNRMLAGLSASKICFQVGTSHASFLPSDLDGATPPPPGSPNYFVEMYGGSALALFKFHVDFANPSASSFTGPTQIPVATYGQACGGGTCVPQLGTGQTLDTLGDRLMFRLAYRNFGDHESLVTNHSVTAGSSVGVRWYEIRSPNAGPFVYQQGTYAPDATYRWMGSVGMDQAGDIALGYSASSASIHPALRYTGRVPTDAPGTMQGEVSIIEGPGSQTGGLSRWGDYSSMSIDPVDDCTLWFTSEYQPADGSFNWTTRIASFRFDGCAGGPPPPPTDDFTITASPTSRTMLAGTSTWYGITVSKYGDFNEVVTFSVTGLPANTQAVFNPTSVTGSGTSRLTIYSLRSAPKGTFPLTITGTGTTKTHSTQVSLTIR